MRWTFGLALSINLATAGGNINHDQLHLGDRLICALSSIPQSAITSSCRLIRTVYHMSTPHYRPGTTLPTDLLGSEHAMGHRGAITGRVFERPFELASCFVVGNPSPDGTLTVLLRGPKRARAVIELTFNYGKQFWTLERLQHLFAHMRRQAYHFYDLPYPTPRLPRALSMALRRNCCGLPTARSVIQAIGTNVTAIAYGANPGWWTPLPINITHGCQWAPGRL